LVGEKSESVLHKAGLLRQALARYREQGIGRRNCSCRKMFKIRQKHIRPLLVSRSSTATGSWIPPQYDARNQIALFDPTLYDSSKVVSVDTGGNIIQNSGNRPEGMRFVSDGSLPKGGWNDRGIMPELRFGFAYDVFSSHKTVIRGGTGMMHNRVQGNLIFNPVFNNPAIVQTAQVPAKNMR